MRFISLSSALWGSRVTVAERLDRARWLMEKTTVKYLMLNRSASSRSVRRLEPSFDTRTGMPIK